MSGLLVGVAWAGFIFSKALTAFRDDHVFDGVLNLVVLFALSYSLYVLIQCGIKYNGNAYLMLSLFLAAAVFVFELVVFAGGIISAGLAIAALASALFCFKRFIAERA
jgi:hypothetical protein